MNENFSISNKGPVCPDEASVVVRQVFKKQNETNCPLAVPLLIFLAWSVLLFLGLILTSLCFQRICIYRIYSIVNI